MELYTTWNRRCVPIFKEEIIQGDWKMNDFPSIKQFQRNNVYTPELRKLISDYINSCPCIIATTSKRQNPYKEGFDMELAYFTDGEVIFNNFLHQYIRQNNFAIPSLWLNVIEGKKFKLSPLALNYELLSDPALNVFKTLEETFEDIPSIKKAIL